MAAKTVIISDKEVQNSQMAEMSYLANFWTKLILIGLRSNTRIDTSNLDMQHSLCYFIPYHQNRQSIKKSTSS